MTVVNSLRVRKVDANGDRVFGNGQADFHRNTPDAVGLVVEARLNLWQGQWYLDPSAGVPYETDVLGHRTEGVRDAVIQEAILDSPGVTGLAAYASVFGSDTRSFAPEAIVETQFGVTDPVTGVATTSAIVRLPVEKDR